MDNPKMKSFNSYVFVHEARNDFFFKCEKPHFLEKKTNRYLLNNYGEI